MDVAGEEMQNLNQDVGCVIASLTYELSFMKLMKAVSYLDNPDVIFLGTNTDPVFPIRKGCVVPGIKLSASVIYFTNFDLRNLDTFRFVS